jgi:uncharacterized protein
MIASTGRPIEWLMGVSDALKPLQPGVFAEERFGAVTAKDLLVEPEKPCMLPVGTVSNLTAFGAFVDLGVHQVGLVHVSRLAPAW